MAWYGYDSNILNDYDRKEEKTREEKKVRTFSVHSFRDRTDRINHILIILLDE